MQGIEWFDINYMLLNADKCQSSATIATENEKFPFDGNTYVNSKEKKILGIIMDNDL